MWTDNVGNLLGSIPNEVSTSWPVGMYFDLLVNNTLYLDKDLLLVFP